MEELIQLSASDAVQKITSREITVSDYVNACLAHICRIEPAVQAWAFLNEEAAVANASRLDQQLDRATANGALFGVPIGVKDIFNTIDMPTQMGSPIWKGFTPGNDARVVHYLRNAGAVIPGKTVTAEFAVHTPGATSNPHNLAHAPGTSSSGSAAAVASYMVPLAIGTQTAGSMVRPASYCGVFGFKPSFGLIPRTGMLKTTDTLDTVGVFARTIDDLKSGFEVMRVHGLDYPIIAERLSDSSRQKKGSRPWRVAVVQGPRWSHAEQYARDALGEFVDRVANESDVVVEELSLPDLFSEGHEIQEIIYDRTLAYYFKEEFRNHTLVSPIMYEIIERGNAITLDQYKHALDRQAGLARELDQLLEERYDVIITLSTGGEAPLRNEADRPDSCLLWTLCGAPVISLPVFHGPTGLPFGAQIISRRYSDYLVLEFAEWLRERGLVCEDVYPRLRVTDLYHRVSSATKAA